MVWFLLMLVLLPISARGADLVIPAEPDQVEIRDVKFYRVAYGFQEETPGHFQLQVTLRYRTWTSRLERVKRYTFRLQSGATVQRDDRTLVLRLDNREVTVGRHRWWYSPYWQPTDKVRIACDRNRGIRHLVIENCRLIMKNYTLSAAKATAGLVDLTMPNADTESVSWLPTEWVFRDNRRTFTLGGVSLIGRMCGTSGCGKGKRSRQP
jgi:hypothetical protein